MDKDILPISMHFEVRNTKTGNYQEISVNPTAIASLYSCDDGTTEVVMVNGSCMKAKVGYKDLDREWNNALRYFLAGGV